MDDRIKDSRAIFGVPEESKFYTDRMNFRKDLCAMSLNFEDRLYANISFHPRKSC